MSATELTKLFDAYRAVARTSDVSHHGADAISEATLAENCDGEDILEMAASRAIAIDVASLDLAVPQSLRSAKATSSGSMAERRERARVLTEQHRRARESSGREEEEEKREQGRIVMKTRKRKTID